MTTTTTKQLKQYGATQNNNDKRDNDRKMSIHCVAILFMLLSQDPLNVNTINFVFIIINKKIREHKFQFVLKLFGTAFYICDSF